MMTIRKAQMDALNDFSKKSFELYTVKYLKAKYSDETKDKNDEEMLHFVQEGIKKSVQYKIVEHNDILTFFEYIICFGNDFESNPANKWATDVFRIRNLPGNEKIFRLRNNRPI